MPRHQAPQAGAARSESHRHRHLRDDGSDLALRSRPVVEAPFQNRSGDDAEAAKHEQDREHPDDVRHLGGVDRASVERGAEERETEQGQAAQAREDERSACGLLQLVAPVDQRGTDPGRLELLRNCEENERERDDAEVLWRQQADEDERREEGERGSRGVDQRDPGGAPHDLALEVASADGGLERWLLVHETSNVSSLRCSRVERTTS